MFHIQYPVGQGGLHLGIVDDIAYVYDCGAVRIGQCTAAVRCAANIINNSEVKEVHIFISHLHEDHCNGLERLLHELKITNKTVHIPYIDDEEKLLILGSVHSINILSKFYINLVYCSQDDNNEELGFKVVQYRESIALTTLANSYGWVFDCFVNKFVNSSDVSKFMSWVHRNIPGKLNKNTLLAYLSNKTNRKKLRDAYLKYITTHLNFTSLCLYCGPCVGSVQYKSFGGWLHTGDYNLKDKNFWKPFFQHYKQYYNYIEWLQIPHHGSKNNISVSLLCYLQKRCHYRLFLTSQLNPRGRGQPKVDSGLYSLSVCKVTECPCSLLSTIPLWCVL